MRRPALLLALACLLLGALAAPAPASLGITEWNGVALDKPPGHAEPPYEGFIYKPPPAFSSLPGGSPSGVLANQAGTHPEVWALRFALTTTVTPANQEVPTEELRDATIEIPPGLIGNPQALPRCPVSDLRIGGGDFCVPNSQIGVVRLRNSKGDASDVEPFEEFFPLYNMEPPPGVAALVGFQTFGVQVFIAAKLRTGGDYGVTVASHDANQTVPYKGFTSEVWGTPGDASHDLFRDACLTPGGDPFEEMFNVTGKPCPSGEEDPRAFLTLPTSCLGPQQTNLAIRGWLGGEDEASFTSHDLGEPPAPNGIEGCDKVPFAPSVKARPSTDVADAPSGLDFDLHIPQGTLEDPDAEPVQSHLKDAVVKLPEGMTVNPSGANGLDACSPAQIDLHGEGPPQCPDASKVGRVEVSTPLIGHPLPGALYVAKPFDNPFGSLLALYLVVDDAQSGIVIKLAGKVEADLRTGQLTSSFKDNPQAPVEDVALHVKEGAHAPLRTPAVCGKYTTTSRLTPWTAANGGGGQLAFPSDTYTIARGPGGGCATSAPALPNSPELNAGTTSPIAGRYAPLVIELRRADGSQQFSKVSLTPPPGLVAKLAGTAYCPEAALAAAAARKGAAEKASPSCPADSRLGAVHAAAGAGPSPYWATGEAYLAGPYKGAPLSMAIVTPAVAGPFDLGTVVVRVALDIDPATAKITAVSDPLPELLQGIPLDVRVARVLIDRPDFTLNGTSCNPLAFSGELTSTLGQTAPLTERFQLAECSRLGFKPRISLALHGNVHRGDYQGLTAVVRPRAGDADIARSVVRMPRSVFVAQENFRTICTRVQFAADACPKGSIYGRAEARSPLVDYTLSGPVYLRSSDNELPDAVAALSGPESQPIHVELAFRNDSLRGGLRATVQAAPDVPASYFRLELFGKRKALLVNSRDICAEPYRATVTMRAHNGKSFKARPLLRNPKCKGGKGRGGGKGGHKGH